MSKNDNNYIPGTDDDGSLHFVEAVLNETGRLGSKDDEEFLASVTGELQKVSADVEENPKTVPFRRKRVFHYAAAAAILTTGFVLILMNQSEQEVELAVNEAKMEEDAEIRKLRTNSEQLSSRRKQSAVEEEHIFVDSLESIVVPPAPSAPNSLPAIVAGKPSVAGVTVYSAGTTRASGGGIQGGRLSLSSGGTLHASSVEMSAGGEITVTGSQGVLSVAESTGLSVIGDSLALVEGNAPAASAPPKADTSDLYAYGRFKRKEMQVEEEVRQQLAGRPALPAQTSSERYDKLVDNEFTSPLTEPLSTFSIDVDTASYSNIRRMITDGSPIPEDAVRIEEMINYFHYDYPQPEGKDPFSFAIETAECPWNTDHQLMRVGIQGKEMAREKRPDANLVFLIDVSGSMQSANKLPLVKKSMDLLIEELTERDTISLVVYAGSEGLCLPPTRGDQKERIAKSLQNLRAGGSTNGGAGISLAYKLAKENYRKDGINRVILCTDGDFNVGTTGQDDLVDLVKKGAKSGTYLSVLGFGSGNINDSMLEAITNHGNGNYAYIDSIREGRKVLLQDLMSMLVTIAKDVKIQIEFNPKHVQQYRLIGYANRMLAAEDFANDKVDAGEVGAGHSVTALYEIVPAGAPPIQRIVTDRLKYQQPVDPPKPKMKLVGSDELCTVKLRYKRPDETKSILMEQPVTYQTREWQQAGEDYQWAAATALWGMNLRNSRNKGEEDVEPLIRNLAEQGKGNDPFGRRAEMIQLIQKWAGK